MVGKFSEREAGELADEARDLERELRQEWRARRARRGASDGGASRSKKGLAVPPADAGDDSSQS
jgi:hypothetical protein